jgi:hypothetical protein
MGCLFSVCSICCKSESIADKRKTELIVISQDETVDQNGCITRGKSVEHILPESETLLDNTTELTVTVIRTGRKVNAQ